MYDFSSSYMLIEPDFAQSLLRKVLVVFIKLEGEKIALAPFLGLNVLLFADIKILHYDFPHCFFIGHIREKNKELFRFMPFEQCLAVV